MSLMDSELGTVTVLPLVPADGRIVYENCAGDLLIVAVLASGDVLASIWTWREGDANWTRNYAC